MFVGHFGLALGAKSAVPRVSLGTLFLSVQLADALWPLLLLAGLERVRIVPNLMATSHVDFTHYPISHSLLALCRLFVPWAYWIDRHRAVRSEV